MKVPVNLLALSSGGGKGSQQGALSAANGGGKTGKGQLSVFSVPAEPQTQKAKIETNMLADGQQTKAGHVLKHAESQVTAIKLSMRGDNGSLQTNPAQKQFRDSKTGAGSNADVKDKLTDQLEQADSPLPETTSNANPQSPEKEDVARVIARLPLESTNSTSSTDWAQDPFQSELLLLDKTGSNSLASSASPEIQVLASRREKPAGPTSSSAVDQNLSMVGSLTKKVENVSAEPKQSDSSVGQFASSTSGVADGARTVQAQSLLLEGIRPVASPEQRLPVRHQLSLRDGSGIRLAKTEAIGLPEQVLTPQSGGSATVANSPNASIQTAALEPLGFTDEVAANVDPRSGIVREVSPTNGHEPLAMRDSKSAVLSGAIAVINAAFTGGGLQPQATSQQLPTAATAKDISTQIAQQLGTELLNMELRPPVASDRSISMGMSNNILTLQLHPIGLGRVQAEIRRDAEAVRIKLTVETANTLEIMKGDLDVLKQAMRALGAAEGDVTLTQGNITRISGDTSGQFQNMFSNDRHSDSALPGREDRPGEGHSGAQGDGENLGRTEARLSPESDLGDEVIYI